MSRHKTAAATYTKIMLRLPHEILELYRHRAAREHRSLNAQIVHELSHNVVLDHDADEASPVTNGVSPKS